MSLEGSWDVTFTTAMGATQEQWSIETVDGELRVRGTSADGESTDEALAVDGDAFSYELPVPNMPLKATIEGRLEGDRLTGKGRLAAMQFGTFEATRSA